MKVFLSSTALDLAAYRQVADDTILRLSQQTVAMERFGPLRRTPVDECERLARESDVLVCIVAHRYGFVPEKGKGSITRREVEAAHKAGKDVLVWIVDDSFPWTEKKEQDLLADPNVVDDPARVEEVREGVAGLIEFKAWLRKIFTPETFTTPDDLGRKIAITLGAYVRGHSATSLPKENISISRLPTSGAELFGRETELQLLDDAWANPNTNIVSFVAWGGVGKTALVNHWLKKRMARDNYRGAERVYGWSFFSQGTSERAASADLFIDQALRWFGDTDPTAGSPWDKGERIANYLRQTRTLLILDGLEPLQHPPGPREGTLKDAAMQALLVELAAQQPGLCVISTRERIGDLIEFEDSTLAKHDLDCLSPQAGAQILRSLNVKGSDEELEQASRELGGHAFSLTLLGSYLDEVLEGDIRRRTEIKNLFDDTRFGGKAQAMIVAYEHWLGEGMELAILRILGFFDRPANPGSIGALREPPAILGLTESLQHFKTREWNQAVAKLRRIKLLAEASTNEPRTLDAHPLLREHFKQQLKRERPNAWREGNNRLYEHLKTTTKEFPDSIEEMSPLYAAVGHGCSANKYADAFVEVYWPRIRRGAAFDTKSLGAFGASLAVLTSFFEDSWQNPVSGLPPTMSSFAQGQAGFCLRSLGRLEEAAGAISSAIANAGEKSENAIRSADNLCDVYILIGRLAEALTLSERTLEWAEQLKAEFLRTVCRTTKANALHQTGRLEEANLVFGEAERLQQAWQTEYQILYSTRGFHYCDLLLDQGKSDEVKNRASKTLAWARSNNALQDIALDTLSLGRAWLLDASRGSTDGMVQARELARQAVTALRAAGVIDYLALGLMMRAAFYRLASDFVRAERDLSEVHRIVTRSGMNLYRADLSLELSRLRLAKGKRDKARSDLNTAREMIDRMGYHRRDQEVKDLEERLA